MTTPLQAYRQAIITTRRQPNRPSGARNYGSARINHLLISDVGLGFLFSEMTHTQLTDFDIEDLYNYSFAPEYHTSGRRTFYQLRSRYNSRNSAGRQNVNWTIVDRRPRNRTAEDVQRRADVLNRILIAARALGIRIDPADNPGTGGTGQGSDDDSTEESDDDSTEEGDDDSASQESEEDSAELDDDEMDVDQTTDNSGLAEQDSLLDADGETDNEYAHDEDEDMDNQISDRDNHSQPGHMNINEGNTGSSTQQSTLARTNMMSSQLNSNGILRPQSNNLQPGQSQGVPPFLNTRLHIEQFQTYLRVVDITGDLYPGRDQHDAMIIMRFHAANARFTPRQTWDLAQTQQAPDQARLSPVVSAVPRPSTDPNTMGLRQVALLHTQEPLDQEALAGLMYLDQLNEEEEDDAFSPSPPALSPPPQYPRTINPALLSIPERHYWPRGQSQNYGMTFGQAVLAFLYCFPWLIPEQAIQLLRDANGELQDVVPHLIAISDPESPWSHGVWDEGIAYAITPTLVWYMPEGFPAWRPL